MADGTLVLRLMLTAGLSVAGVGVLCAWILYAISRSSRDPLLPPWVGSERRGTVLPSLPGLSSSFQHPESCKSVWTRFAFTAPFTGLSFQQDGMKTLPRLFAFFGPPLLPFRCNWG